MQGVPIFFDYATAVNNAVTPSSVKVHDNIICDFYARYFFKRVLSILKFDNLPKSWDKDYFRTVLFAWGIMPVIDSPEMGVIPIWGTLAGRRYNYAPAQVIVENPVLQASNGAYWIYHAGEDVKMTMPATENVKGKCALIKLQPDYCGIMDLCYNFAARMALIFEDFVVNATNSKLAYVFTAKSKAAAETFKQMVEDVANGNPAVAAHESLWSKTDGTKLWDTFAPNLKQNYLLTDLLNDARAVCNEFDSFVGIPSANTTKRERLNSDEVNANNVETETLLDTIFESVSDGVEDVNALFGLNITVRKRYETGVAENVAV